jgi:serine/threonine-protein kinase
MTDSFASLAGDEQDRRDRAQQVYAEARTLTPEARAPFVEQACRGDEELRSELHSLLEHAEAAEAFFARLSTIVIPPEPPPSPAGGHYQVMDCIGGGGMGAVYRARDTRLNRDVALKFLPVHLGTTALDAEARLLVEARAAAALEHANVCTVHEIGETEDGRPFIAMALYEGETLKERLVRGPLAVAEAIEIAAQIARGLGAAHAQGIVHRDVKPGNIMLTPGGTVKLLDFGLAKVADVSLTRPGTTPGTVAYMSPEQARGDVVGTQSDLWSLGVVLCEMLTGVQPFRGGNDRAVIQAIRHDSPEPLRNTRPDATRSLERIVARLLQKEPQARYSSTDQLLGDLTRVLASPGSTMAWRIRVPSARRRPALLAVSGGLVVGLGAATLWLGERGAGPAHATAAESTRTGADNGRDGRARTIAVLPFTNLSRDPEEEYFSDGLTEELVTALAQVRALRVAARTSAFVFKDENRDIREIGVALDVGTVLEGSVRKDGNRVRVLAQLIDVEDGFHLWSESYDREGTDIFAIQRDLALRIASALEAELSPAERERLARRPTASAEAFTLYLRGRHFWNQRSSAGFRRAIEYFERAIDADPQYASAYAGLAAVYSLQGLSGELEPREAQDRMRAAALKAIELDDGLAEAHAALGSYLHTFAWDSEAAEREQLRAIELDPSYPTARHFYGNLLRAMGRLDESLAQKTRALDLDPLVPVLSESLAFTLLGAGRPAEALQHIDNVLEQDSTFRRGHSVLGLIYEATDRLEEALRAHERAGELAKTPQTSADIARVLARMGRTHEARQLLERLEQEALSTGVFEPSLASVRLSLNDVQGALAWLEQGYQQRHPGLRFMSGDPRFSAFADEPQYIDLLRRVGVRP